MTLDEAIQRAVIDLAHKWQGPTATSEGICELLADRAHWDGATFDRAIADVVTIARRYVT